MLLFSQMIAAAPPLALLQLRWRKIMSAKGDLGEGEEEMKKSFYFHQRQKHCGEGRKKEKQGECD